MKTFKKTELPNAKDIILREISELRHWFNTIYTVQTQKYERSVRMGIHCDVDILALDTEAEEKRAQINALEVELEDEINGR